ncbi:MAG TPA: leucine--tRNA ligase [Saprospiraceae bacterium]|nr:leucine--tRNA ligase [Saprospiraceae bacterium]
MDFQPSVIEKKWKKYWTESQVYKVENDSSKPKFYVLDMFPYPSGSGLHVGHPLGYIASDIYARYKRLKGFNVLHPMGYDAFGLPAEQYAIQSGIHPSISTDQNISQYRKQLDNIGFSFDWSREVKTSDPSYYKWTQWIFLQLFHHYYDRDENKAKPITDLIKTFEKAGNTKVNAHHSHEGFFTAGEWLSMDAIKKDEVLMGYRLAYRKTGYVNWCEALGTVLANDEVRDGFSERGGYPVEKRAMKQWSLRITAYAERLLNDLDHLDWSDSLKMMQRNWIGRSEGAQLFFDLDGHSEKIEIFTTRPDTIFGATYMVLAPEHDLVDRITTASQKKQVDEYKQYVSSRSEVDRMSEVKEVTGVFTGAYAIHPFTKEKIPVWIGEYVLKDYGTGAIMAVPSDDERDFAFAKKFNLPVIDVIDKSNYPGSTLHDKTGVVINSGFLNGIEVPDAILLMYDKIESMGIGQKKINYKLRDANFSRQRYWGEPFPIYYDQEGVAHGLPEADLPLCLPELEDFKPGQGGKSPLSRLAEWTDMGDGRYRETDTMPGFAGSSWYFLRYMDANNEKEFASREAVEYWKDVDLYIGGTEHAVGHLMYSRFWHKFLYDKNLVPTYEPFKKLVNQGMIQGIISTILLRKEKIDGFNTFVCFDLLDEGIDSAIKISIHTQYVKNYGSTSSYLDKKGILSFVEWMPEYRDARFQSEQGTFTIENLPEDFTIRLGSEVGKMSKRYHNVVNPDDIVEKYGADCFRMYEMFLGPIDQAKPWDTKGIDGVAKFLRKFWSLYFDENGWKISNAQANQSDLKTLHATIKKVTDDIEKLSFNTAVSAFMVCVNELKKSGTTSAEVLEPLLRLMAPFAPFITEELYHRFNKVGSVHTSSFPEFEEKYLIKDNIVYPVCINGKKRDTITLPLDMSTDEVQSIVLNMESIKKWIDGKIHKKFIIVPGRMVNIVI